MQIATAESWYETERLENGVTYIGEPHIKAFYRCNIWHVRGRDRDMLVDSGMGVVSLREQVPLVTERPLTAVASHTHYDHIGAHHEFPDRVVHGDEAGLLADAVLSKSEAEVTALWDVRDGMAESMGSRENAAGFDISLNVADMAGLEAELTARLLKQADTAEVLIGGHLGDGNLHLAVSGTRADGPLPPEVAEEVVYGLVGDLGGSISAEHGIGLYKRRHLPQTRSPAELAVMRSLKAALDPLNLLGAGRVFEMT